MSNPWAIKLKKTGFLEKHLETEKSKIIELEERQLELRTAEITNNVKNKEYKDRQESMVVNAIAGQQEKLPGQ
jgi:hypothetical protein